MWAEADYDELTRRARSGSDASFASKFVDIPGYIESWSRQFGGLAGSRILDFGCGVGVSACGIAARLSPALVVGVDVNDESAGLQSVLQANLGVQSLPDNLVFERIRPGEISTHSGFDFVYCWSVFEHVHVDLYPSVLKGLRDRMNDGAHIYVQIAPLYFSKEGAHLWEIGYSNFEHLRMQISDIQQVIFSTPLISEERRSSLWSMFSTLNRITADRLIEKFQDAGFSLVQEQRNESDSAPSDLLGTYQESVLRTFQIVALFKK